MELPLVLFECRFAKVGNTVPGATSMRTSRHLHRDEAAAQNEMADGHAMDGSPSSWRLSLLRSVMGDSICETGSYFVIAVLVTYVETQVVSRWCSS